MKEDKKQSENYIEELEAKIVELTLQLKAKNNELYTVRTNNFTRTRKVVHNLKNPIGVAFSFAEILETIDCVKDNEKNTKYINIIKNSNDYSIQFLNTFSKLNKLRAPDYKLLTATTNYSNLLQSAVKEFTDKANYKDRLILNNTSKENIFLNVVSSEIEFLIRILISNALRFSSKETTVTVKVNDKPDYVETVIKDEGIGISETDLEKIFNEFFVVNTYDVSNDKCIGLGLTMAKEILEHHKGSIEIKSTLNSSTEVRILIPKM